MSSIDGIVHGPFPIPREGKRRLPVGWLKESISQIRCYFFCGESKIVLECIVPTCEWKVEVNHLHRGGFIHQCSRVGHKICFDRRGHYIGPIDRVLKTKTKVLWFHPLWRLKKKGAILFYGSYQKLN